MGMLLTCHLLITLFASTYQQAYMKAVVLSRIKPWGVNVYLYECLPFSQEDFLFSRPGYH